MALPQFLLRKLFLHDSLRELPGARFTFSLHNPLGSATLTGPPQIVVNGIAHDPGTIRAGAADLASISEQRPFKFLKGDSVDLIFNGHLLRGGNRIHVTVPTKEWGEIDFLVEVKGAAVVDDSEEE